MGPLKTMGIVIRATQTGDYNKMLTVLSRDLGKISVWARGTKSPKHPAAASTSLLCYSEFVLNKRKDIYSLSSATLEEGFYGIRNSLQKLSHAMYFSSLAENVCHECIESDEIVRLLLNTLYYLNKEKKEINDLRLMYELKLLTYSGFSPNTAICSICGKKPLFFDSSVGGAVCEDCKKNTTKSISSETLALIDFYVTSSQAQSLSYAGQIRTVKEGSMHIEDFIKIHIGHITALEYLKSVMD